MREIRIELSKERARAPELPGEEGNEFAVCLASSVVETSYGCNLSVVACNDDLESQWSWCTLQTDEKAAIGDMLKEVGANLDEWWFCLMYISECKVCGGSGSYREDRGIDKEPFKEYCDCPAGDELKIKFNDPLSIEVIGNIHEPEPTAAELECSWPSRGVDS